MRHIKRTAVAFIMATGVMAAGVTTTASAALIYDESVNGDFSGNRLAPTVVSIVTPGFNQINGVTGNPGSTSATADKDYFTITIPDGYSLNALVLTNFSLTAGNLGFLGIAPGATAPDPTLPQTTLEAALVGYTHLSPSMDGTNILPVISHALGSPGFSQSLGAGTYTFWLQDTSAGTSDPYTLTLDIPEPGSWALALTGLAGLRWAQRRRRTTSAG